jgi:hypothetical protein
MKCIYCGKESRGSIGGKNICPSCDCGLLNWCTENQCGRFPINCYGTYHPALCPMMDNSDSEINNED